MNQYDFLKLNDKEFESLVIDVLSEELGTRIERFKSGKDGGVDGRYFSTENNEAILQCKHWPRSGVRKLISNLRQNELEKIKRLSPHKYLFITSLELSRQNKIEIRKALSPYIRSSADIYGSEDINDLLSKYPNIEKNHYKLWLSSANVLQAILHAGVVGRSASKLEDVATFSNKYVLTDTHNEATKILEDKHVLIITGAPGIGKTTLADQLCLGYSARGFDLCYVQESLGEAEDLYVNDKKQIFYFDDFLGRSYLEALHRHEDSQIIDFIKRVERDGRKRFILTSRTNILNQGKQLSDLFKAQNIDRNEYEIKVSSYSKYDKARILYNHIWFSELTEKYVEEIYLNKRYREVIDHDNYNPRVIAFITDYQKVADVPANNYWEYIKETLDNPSEIWAHVYDNQLDSRARWITTLVAINGGPIIESKLRDAYKRFLSKNPNIPLANVYSDFLTKIRILVGALLNRHLDVKNNNEASYDLFNPSIGDFLVSRNKHDADALYESLINLRTKSSLNNWRFLCSNNIVTINLANSVTKRLCDTVFLKNDEQTDIQYKISLFHYLITNKNLTIEKELIKNYITRIDLTQIVVDIHSIDEVIDVYEWALENEVIHDINKQVVRFIKNNIKLCKSHYNYSSMTGLMERVDEEDVEELMEIVQASLYEFWLNHVDEYAQEQLTDLYEVEEIDSALNSLKESMEMKMYDYAMVTLSDSQIDDICETVDFNGIIEINRENAAGDDYQQELWKETRYHEVSENDAIDDLFERSE